MVSKSLLCAGLLLSVNLVFAAGESLLDLAQREIIVKWRRTPQSLDAAELLPRYAAQVERISAALPACDRRSELAKASLIRARDAASAASLLSSLNADPRVEYAELRPIRQTDFYKPDRRNRDNSLDAVPNDPFYSQQWGLQAVDAEAAWTEVLGDPSVTIAVVDIGVWFGHPELEGISWVNQVELDGAEGVDDDNNGYIDDVYGYDFVNQDGDPSPEPFEPAQSHGTHVAGIAAAHRNNGRGIAGIASGCRIMGVRAGSGSSITYGYEGIYYACRAGAKIINCSWGGSADSQYEREVVQYVLEQGCVIVASAGNGNTILPHYPAAIEGVISVAATGLGDQAAVFTHYGPWVKVSAPGINILSTIWSPSGQPSYASWQGTSMSAPLVAGICALVAVRYPGIGGRELASRVISSSDPIDYNNPSYAGWIGLGRVNAWRAVADELIGVSFDDIEVVESGVDADGRLLPGEPGELTVTICNDLNNVDGVIGTIATTFDSVEITAPLAVYGNLTGGGPFEPGSPFEISLISAATRQRSIPFSIDWNRADGRLLGRTFLNVVVDSTWVAVDNGMIRLGFGEDGSLGYHDFLGNVSLGPGLRIDDGPTQMLYHGTFMLGAGGRVADNAYGSGNVYRYDWRTMAGRFAELVSSDRADIVARAAFDDRGSDPLTLLFAEVEAVALGWTDSEAADFLILEYTITNRSVNPWVDARAGFYMDWDIISPGANVGGCDAEGDLAYAYQTLPGFSMIGIASLSDPLTAVQTIGNREEFDSDSTEWGDPRKWELMTSGLGESSMDPMDISQVIAVGPLQVDAGSSRTVAFAVVSGETLPDLRQAALSARARYIGPVLHERPPTEETVIAKATLRPNPVSGGGPLKLILPEEGRARVRFFNILGQVVADFPEVQSGPLGTNLDLTQFNSASGLLFYSIELNGKQTLGKLVRLR